MSRFDSFIVGMYIALLGFVLRLMIYLSCFVDNI